MMKHETNWYPEAIPGFSCLKMKQEIQEQIYQEIEHLSDAEIVEHFRQAGERCRRRRAEHSQTEKELSDY